MLSGASMAERAHEATHSNTQVPGEFCRRLWLLREQMGQVIRA